MTEQCKHKWKKWKKTDGIVDGLDKSIQERTCKRCGWIQLAKLEDIERRINND